MRRIETLSKARIAKKNTKSKPLAVQVKVLRDTGFAMETGITHQGVPPRLA